MVVGYLLFSRLVVPFLRVSSCVVAVLSSLSYVFGAGAMEV